MVFSKQGCFFGGTSPTEEREFTFACQPGPGPPCGRQRMNPRRFSIPKRSYCHSWIAPKLFLPYLLRNWCYVLSLSRACGSLEQLKKLHNLQPTKDCHLHFAWLTQFRTPEQAAGKAEERISLERRGGHRGENTPWKGRLSWGTIHLTFIHSCVGVVFLLPKNTSILGPDSSLT